MSKKEEMSRISEMSSAGQNRAQGSGPSKKRIALAALIVAILLLAGFLGIMFAAGLFWRDGSETETEEDASIPDGPSHPGRTVMCTTRYPGPGNDPPRYICDIVVYDADEADLSIKPPQEVQFFIDYCKKGLSACGINIEFPEAVAARLDTAETKKIMADFYEVGIRNYGLLRSVMLPSTTKNDLKNEINLLKKLETFLRVTGENHDTLFWGVSPVLKGAGRPPDRMVKVFRDILKTTRVNMVVYQTTFVENITGGCIFTGPSMWKSSFYSEQTTFVDALNFWKAVKAKLLSGVSEMFAITLCGFWAEYSLFGDRCKQTLYDYIEHAVCPESSAVNPRAQQGALVEDELQHVAIEMSYEWTVGYDLNDTIVDKMCKAKSDYGYDGGWVVHSLQCNFKQFCRGKEMGGFPRLRVMDEALQKNLTRC